MGIGIDIRVNSEQVIAAKREVGLLSDSMREAKELGGKIDIAPRGIPELLSEFKQIGAGVGAVVEEMKRLQGLRFDTPDFSKITDSMRQTQRLADRVAAPQQQSAQQQPTGEPRRQSLQDRIGISRPPMAEKPDSHYHSLIKTMQPFPKAEEAAAKEMVTSLQPTGEPRRQSGEPGLSSSEKEWRRIQGEPRSPLDLDPLKTKGDQYSQIMQDSRRLQNIGQQGELQGGKLNKRQLDEYKQLSERIGKNFAGWEQGIAKAQTALSKLNSEQKQLEKTSTQDPGAWIASQSRIQEIEAEKKRLQNVIDINSRRDERVQGAKQRVQDTQSNVSGYGTQNDPQGHGSLLKKIAGFTAAAAGIGSIAAYIASSRSSYRASIESESPLYARGLHGARDRAGKATGLGIAPDEWYGLENSLSRNTGLNEKNMGRNSMLTASFAKYGGLDTAEVAGLRGNIYNATGSNEAIPNSVLLSMGEATRQGLSKARLPELLASISRATNSTAQNMHGAGVSPEQIGALTRLSTAALSLKDSSSYKVYAKSAEFGNVMQNGLQGAGTGAGDIRIFKALGGFDGPMTYEKIHKMNVMKQGGFMENPELLTRLIGGLSSTSKEGRAGELETMMESWGIKGKASEKLIEMNDSGFLDKLAKSGKSIDGMAKDGDKEAARWLKEIQQNPALGRQSTEATKDLVKIEVGERVSKLFEPMEMAAAKFTGALAAGDWKNSFSIMGKAASEMGPAAKTLLAAGTLIAAGGAMNMIGGAMSMGKGVLGLLSGPGGILAALGLGGIAAVKTFEHGAEGANYLPEDRLNAITGKPPAQPTAFNGRLNPSVANNPKLSAAYKKHAVRVFEASQKYGVPENILAGLIDSESGFSNVPVRQVKLKNGKSISVGGVSQFTEETARQYKINRMNPEQAIDGAAHMLSDLHKKTGSWRESVRQYKGVQSPENESQVDSAFMKAEKYTNNEPKRQALQQSKGGADDSSMQMLADILKTIAGYSEKTAQNTEYRPTTPRPIAVGN